MLTYRVIQNTVVTETTLDEKTNKPVIAEAKTNLTLVRKWTVKDVDKLGVATLEMSITGDEERVQAARWHDGRHGFSQARRREGDGSVPEQAHRDGAPGFAGQFGGSEGSERRQRCSAASGTTDATCAAYYATGQRCLGATIRGKARSATRHRRELRLHAEVYEQRRKGRPAHRGCGNRTQGSAKRT